MMKRILASELRRRQYAAGLVPRREIDALADDSIIDCYITCSGCGAKMIAPRLLETAIKTARNVDHFLELTTAHLHGEETP
jgi:hypothetical protein